MGVQIPMGKGNFEAGGVPRYARRHFDMNCAKTAEPIKMPFGLWTRVSLRKHALDGAQIRCEGAIIRGKDMPMPDDTLP